MTQFKQGVQDVLNVILVVALVGFGVESKLSSLVSTNVFNWIEFGIFALWLIAYFSDVLFFGTTPTIPSTSLNLAPGAIFKTTATLGQVDSIPTNTDNTATDSTLTPPTV